MTAADFQRIALSLEAPLAGTRRSRKQETWEAMT